VNLFFGGNEIGYSNEIDKHHNYCGSHTPWAHIVHMGHNRWLSSAMVRVHLAGVNRQDTYLHCHYNGTVLCLRLDDLYQEPSRWYVLCKSVMSVAQKPFVLFLNYKLLR
jgi:hypothetical protein